MSDLKERTSIERGLIAAVVADNKIEPAIDAKITVDFFADPEYARCWEFILEHWQKYECTPSPKVLAANFPDQWKRFREPEEPLAYYLDEIREARRKEIAQDGIVRAVDALNDGDVEDAIAMLGQAVMDANIEVSTLQNVDLETTIPERVEKVYDEWRKNPGLRGLSTGFNVINRATRGIQPEQYVVIIGAQKAGKSTVLMYMGICMNEAGARVLLVGFEMSAEEQAARHDALRAEINHARLLDGKMTKKDRLALLEAHVSEERAAGFILCTDTTATTTVSGIRAQMHQVKPDVVIIDGAYLMQDERGEPAGSAQAMTNISRDLKRLAQSTKIPVIISTQALESKMQKRTGISAFSAGYSSAWGQDCDVMLGIQKKDEPNESELRVLLSRSGPLATAHLRINWEEGLVEEFEPEDSYTDDDPEEEPRGKKPF